jgi:hypothetical protein
VVTLDEAAACIDKPVLAVLPGTTRIRRGVVVEVDERRRLVGVRERRVSHPYDLLPRVWWWAPVHLRVPEQWTQRQRAGRLTQ